MRVPNAGQDLIERRIVREGKALAEAMLTDYADPSGFQLSGPWLQIRTLGARFSALLRGVPIRS